jgi:filamentous hemagglutinin
LAQLAQVSMQRSLRSLQTLQAQQNAQSAARNLALGSSGPNNLGTVAQPLPNVPNGLSVGGLVPGVAGTDPADPVAVASTVPVTVGANGAASITLPAQSAVTLPPSSGGNSQVTVSGVGTVGTVTTGGTITPLTAGVVTSIPPGSTISLTNGGTVTFASGSAAIPSTFSTYAYTSPTNATVSIPSSWSGIGGLTQSTYGPTGGQTPTTVTITQTAQQALLTWQTFNIGKNTTLDFDQSAGGSDVGQWIAINKVADDIVPSQILGAIQAPGQVYVIDQNGILFGGSSQVNVGALVASSLPINDNLVNRGLLNNPDLQFLFSQLDLPSGSQGPTPAFTPQGTSSSPGTAPAPGSYGNGGLVAKVDAAGNLSLVPATGQDGDVVVEAGAQLSSPTTPEHVGGKIALIGPNVNNEGTVSSPDGQVILAAGLQVGFAASSDPSLRGLDVTVGQVSDPTYDGGAGNVSGTVTNDGDIEAMRADVMMTGQNVNQLGVIDSSTSVTLNGRVDLLANYDATVLVNSVNGFDGNTGLYSTESGAVTFGAGSLTQIQPELSSNEAVVGTSLALPSQMEIQGKTIYLGVNSQVLAPNANLSFDAGTWLPNSSGDYVFFNTTGQVYLDQGATVDVSGSENVAASVADNIISVQLLGTELANSPLQQNGALRGATVQVDIRDTGTYDGVNWIGTPLGDVSGYVNLITRDVAQLTVAGGTVAINAGDSVVMQPGSAVDVSGGWINYQGATVQTTEVVSGGIPYNISQATPDRVYSGIFTGFTESSAKYGITQNFDTVLQSGSEYEAGYIQGGNGGSLSISAPAMALDGSLKGQTVAGPQQITPISQLSKTYAGATFLPTTLAISGVPNAGSLSLAFQAQDGTNPSADYPIISPTPPDITFQNGPSGQPAAASFAVDPTTGAPLPLNAARVATVILSPDLVDTDGFGSLSITNSDGSITVPAGVSLNMPWAGSVNSSNAPVAGGSIVFSAANLTIDGTLTAPGGDLLFSVYDVSPYLILGIGSSPSPDSTRGHFTLGSGASLSTAGLVIDGGFASSDNEALPQIITGGTVSIQSLNTNLMAGSAINVSGGGIVSPAGKQTYGNAGGIIIAAGQDLLYPEIVGGKLELGATLEGLSGSTGGTLAITAPLIQIGGNSLENGDTLGSGNTLWLDETTGAGSLAAPDFFSQGGFGTFALTGLGEAIVDPMGHPVIDASGNPEYMPAVLIAPGTTIDPVAQSWEAVTSSSSTYLAATTLPLPSERTPVSLNFNAPGVYNSTGGADLLIARGDFLMGAGASITTDPQTTASGGVSINAQTAAVLGSIIAPGGTISIAGGSTFANPDNLTLLEPTVDLGPDSYLSTKGAVELTQNDYGEATGSVLPGGNINVSGNIVAERGATLDVSGANGVLDVTAAQAGLASASISSPLVALQEDSNGGSIKLSGAHELFTDATLLGAAGGPLAEGGSLTVSSGIFFASSSAIQTPLDPTLIVTQNGVGIPVPSYYPSSGTAIGAPVVDAQGNVIPGMGYFAVDDFDNPASGFASLTLAGTVQFQGPVTLAASGSLTIASNPKQGSGGIIYADSPVILSAPFIALGQTFLGPQNAQQQQSPAYIDSNNNAFLVPPVFGTGSLQVNASLIDVGNLSLQNIGEASFTAAGGDIRGDGTFDLAGDLNVTAGQIYPMTETSFTLAAYDHNGVAGTITIAGSAARPLPLSAGGTLNVYATDISQGGELRAPIGTINLGSGVTTASPTDPIGGGTFDSTQQLILAAGGNTSVSAIDPVTGQVLVIPYGVNVNGVQWIDPAGNNITTAGNGPDGIPAKSITISAVNVSDQAGSSIDLSGGGDIYSYQFVTGTGGTTAVLNLPNNSYAILPSSYSATPTAATYSPAYAQDGYSTADSAVAVGEEVYLNAGSGLKAGYYTLLPSIYALQPGAFLITPQKGAAESTTALAQPDGSSIVPGFLLNGTNPPASGQPLLSLFMVDPPAVVQELADYTIYSGTTYLGQSAAAANTAIPRLPVDAGQLVLAAEATLNIGGSVISNVPPGGLGSLVDIASPNDILIAGTDADLSQVPSSTLVLSASGLSGFGADSLLIGGYRGQATTVGTPVTVTTDDLTVDNAGAGNALTGPDVILASNDNLTLDADSQIEQARTLSSAAPTLVLGQAGVAGSGDGTLVRVTSDPSAQILRLGVDPSAPASLSIGEGATIGGASLTLDSTDESTLLSTALTGRSVNIDSGLISLVLNTTGTTPTPQGLVLSEATLQSLQVSATALSLLSYSSIDIYGNGEIGGDPDATGQYPVNSFALHAAAIRGDGGTVAINAQTLLIDNDQDGVEPGTALATTAGGSLNFNAATVELGAAGQTAVDETNIEGYDNVTFNASGGILLQSAGSTTSSAGTVTPGGFTLAVRGSTAGSGNLFLNAPLIAGSADANQTITAGGMVTLAAGRGPSDATVVSGLGATLDLIGQSITDDSDIVLPSGTLKIEATTGNLVIGNEAASVLDVGGTAKTFNDLTEYTSGGQVTLTSDSGSLSLGPDATVNVSALAGGGNGGSLTVSALDGTFTFAGSTMEGTGGAAGENGTFSLDVGTIDASAALAGNDLTPLETALNVGAFSQAQSIRVRGGTINGTAYDDVYLEGTTGTTQANAANFNLSADAGSIFVEGGINASGATGGSINLIATDSVTLSSQADVTAAGQNFDDAGQGGSVTLEAGSETNGNIPETASPRDPATGNFAPGTAVVDIQSGATIDLSVDANAETGQATGILHLRAPQTVGGSDVQIDRIAGNIVGASAVVLEGYKLYQPQGGSIDSVEGSASTSTAHDGTVYGDALGFTANTNAILTSILGAPPSAAQTALYQVTPGAEIISKTGDLTLTNTWDLSSFRFGPDGVAGDLTLRAAGDLIFSYNNGSPASLSDGFTGYDGSSINSLWQAKLMAGPSWSYQLTAGADFSAADPNRVDSAGYLASNHLGGSVQLGLGAPALPTATNGNTESIVPQYYQVIRTGTGNIGISAGQDVQILDPLATIYTAGTQAAALANFALPNLAYQSPTLGSNLTPIYQASYSQSGGNVTISAQDDIGDFLMDGSGDLTADSTLELPTNWLFRQGFVQNGLFAATHANGPIAATSWWVDFSNFFEGIAALGGGNVSLVAGHDVSNVDAAVPTNARMPGATPNASALVELGGGDLLVQAGNDISGGVYYVERGQGVLEAGGTIHSNSTRATLSQSNMSQLGQMPADSTTWLPTTLFLGQGSFDVAAEGSVLLGPVANPFLLPQSLYNSFYNKTYFSTYAPTDSVDASSLTGSVTLKDNVVDADGNYYEGAGSLTSWYENIQLKASGTYVASQPWLAVVETSIVPFDPAAALLPPTLRATAFSGDIDIVGGLVLSPAAQGTINLAAAGAINGFQPNAVDDPGEVASSYNLIDWGSSTINLSDADPASIPSVVSPLSFPAPASGFDGATWAGTRSSVFATFASLFAETGVTNSVLQTKDALHSPGLLHADDPNPVRLYADTGDISGLTLYSGKFAQIIAGQDITDISFYIQNDEADDITVVSAGRDLIAYDPDSALRLDAQAPGNDLFDQNSSYPEGQTIGAPTNGDLQINGPGTLEALAGRNFDLGVGASNGDGTGAGITSVGNQRDPYLPFAGADVVAGAGLNGPPDYAAFIAQFLAPGSAHSQYLADLGPLLGLDGAGGAQIWAAFNQLPVDRQDVLALNVFYLVLRDAGRDHNNGSVDGGYATGFAAIATLFPGNQWQGDISLTSREIKTENGGNISLLAPGGQLTVGFDIAGNQPVDQGILTDDGGNISIFAQNSVNVGTSRIFTLGGGNEIIWSSDGNIGAGASSKTVQSAPPTRVVIDPQSADVQTDLSGLATGGGIGVLETVVGAQASDVDLIAPNGIVDAGDAGIRASGNLNIAAAQILNAGNIQVGGKSSGVPTATAPNLAGLASASSAAGAANNAESQVANQQQNQAQQNVQDIPSIVTVEVLGYGGA